MKKWNVILERFGKLVEMQLEAIAYQDVYLEVATKFPGWTIKSISEIKN